MAVAPVSDGFIAFAAEGGGPPTELWRSADGRTWDSVAPRGDPVLSVSGIVAAHGRLVVYGNVGNGEQTGAAFWTSDDGLTWRRAQSVFDGIQVTDVAVVDDGFIAVGNGVWVSASGESWERIDNRQFEANLAWGVTAGGPGFVAVGGSAWTSTDARDWSFAPEPPNGESFDVLEHDGTLVTVGNTGGSAGAWTSIDGLSWLPAEVSGNSASGWMRTLIATPYGLMAAGGRNTDAVVWTSPDGRIWRPVDDPAFAGGVVTDAAFADGLFILAGGIQELVPGTSGSYTTTPMVWYGEIEPR
jgi:hypothetical protein